MSVSARLDRLERTPQGLERACATNVVGGFLLSHLLLGELAASVRPGDPARLVHVSSGGMYTQRLDLALLEGNVARYEGLLAYAQHGIASRVLAKSGGGNVTLFAFEKGQALTEHTSPFATPWSSSSRGR